MPCDGGVWGGALANSIISYVLHAMYTAVVIVDIMSFAAFQETLGRRNSSPETSLLIDGTRGI